MPTIPINDTSPRIQYIASAGQTTFIYPFWVTAGTDLSVYLEGVKLTYSADFTATGLLDPNGGSIELTSPAAEGQRITIERDIPFEKNAEFQAGGTFKASVLNLELSKQLALMQQLKRDIDRKIGPAPSSSADGLIMPEPDDGKAIVFDGTSGALRASNVNVDDIDTALTDAQTSAVTATAAKAAAETAKADAELAQASAEAARDTALANLGNVYADGADSVLGTLDQKLAAGQLMFKSVSDVGGGNNVLAMGVNIADQATAEAGTSDLHAMTPEATKYAIDALSSVGVIGEGSFTSSALVNIPLPSGYRVHRLYMLACDHDTNGAFNQVRVDGDNGASDYSWNTDGAGGATGVSAVDVLGSEIDIKDNTGTATGSSGCYYVIDILNAADASEKTAFLYYGFKGRISTSTGVFIGGGTRNALAANSTLNIFGSAGLITGKWIMKGIV